ncbi:hypothetical protein [Novosphingobium colocasiae]|uniref:PBECR3 domain-containing polyvalent protein n=1 Tax=Novosphingobium colocasiae TaxID=1256513 RepID=UPI0035AE3D7A
MTKPKYPAVRVGPLPFAKINRALGTELDEGEVWMSSHAHKHVAVDHPEDYPFIMAALVEIVSSPLYVGQDPKHGENFYVIKPIGDGAPNPHALVVIGLVTNRHGSYNVRSAYTTNQETVNQRRAAKRLHVLL